MHHQLLRRDARHLLKCTAEMRGIGIADGIANLIEFHIRFQNQLLRLGNAFRSQVFSEGHSGVLFEKSRQIIRMHAHHRRGVGDLYRTGEVFLHVLLNLLDLYGLPVRRT